MPFCLKISDDGQGLMLAERIEDDATRANLIKLVRAWLTAAKEIEKTGSNVLVQISAQL
jgi:hypothetical protein